MQIWAFSATVAAMKPPPQCTYITDIQRTGASHLRKVVTDGCAAGVDAVLLREPQMDSGKLLALAASLRVITREHHARLIIHSQADIARAVEADGVHLSAASISDAAAIRRWLGSFPLTLSASCHNASELRAAAASAVDFALLSPVFPTASHPDATALGVDRFRQLTDQQQPPVVALGGITTDNRHLLASYPIAVMRALDEACDITAAVHRLIDQQAAVTQQ